MRHIPMTLALLTAWTAVFPATHASADQISLDVRLVHPTMKADEKQTNYLRIALTGFEMETTEKRSPVNVALVLDRSGSMQGEKLRRAKEAAIAAVDRLGDDDIVSVVLYDTGVSVLVPATKAVDREQIKTAIRGIQSGQSTALFAGVSKGAAEIRKFLSKDLVNRVILLSDGLANVGPSSPQDLEGLGSSLIKEGISVSTLGLGLGYNEDLMLALAAVGGGNHAFIENADDLVTIFNQEFDGLLSVVANDFDIEIKLDSSVRPVRLVGTEGEIEGQSIRIPLSQLYAKQQRYFILETEVSAGENGQSRPMADVTVKYHNLKTGTTDKLSNSIQVRFSDSEQVVESSKDLETYAYCTLQVTNERNRRATSLRDAGQIDEAKKLLKLNVLDLKACSVACEAQGVTSVLPELKQVELGNSSQAIAIDDNKRWGANRKVMRAMQNRVESQQTYDGYIQSESQRQEPSTSSSSGNR